LLPFVSLLEGDKLVCVVAIIDNRLLIDPCNQQTTQKHYLSNYLDIKILNNFLNLIEDVTDERFPNLSNIKSPDVHIGTLADNIKLSCVACITTIIATINIMR
tara:strand:+ start:1827 stop:2135 length:309 start_codon:yes stop_codon:yes gene_type:complete